MGLSNWRKETLHNAAAATGNGAAFDIMGYPTVVFDVRGTFVGTVIFEATTNDTDWDAIPAENITTLAKATTATSAGQYRASVAGVSKVRARISAYTSGSITVEARATTAVHDSDQMQITGSLPAFAATPTVAIDQTTPGTTNGVQITKQPDYYVQWAGNQAVAAGATFAPTPSDYDGQGFAHVSLAGYGDTSHSWTLQLNLRGSSGGVELTGNSSGGTSQGKTASTRLHARYARPFITNNDAAQRTYSAWLRMMQA